MIENKPAALTFNGRRTVFRSRLEARWAAYFASRGLTWEYEPFKFPVANGVTYTPDFKVEGIGIIEVKPHFDALADSVERIEQYVEKTKERVYLLHGPSPIDAGVTILTNTPLKGYPCDGMQCVLILGGEGARSFAIQNYDDFRASVIAGLNAASSRDAMFDPLTVGEMMAINGPDPRNNARCDERRRPLVYPVNDRSDALVPSDTRRHRPCGKSSGRQSISIFGTRRKTGVTASEEIRERSRARN
jgi:hypothetical protein